jgi:hypothetical protein
VCLSTTLPKSVVIVWILVTLLVPIGIYFWMIAGNMALIGGIVYSFLWLYTIGPANLDFDGTSIFGIYIPVDANSIFYGIHILNPLVLIWVPFFGLFNILFAIQVVRHTKGKASLKSTIVVGLLTLAMPLYQTTIYLPIVLRYSYFSYTGPIPIQLILGLCIIKKYSPKPIESPWEEETQ